MSQPFKELFKRMRELGYFGNYESYEEYLSKEENFGKEPPKSGEPRNIEGWKRTLDEEDKKRYNKMFK